MARVSSVVLVSFAALTLALAAPSVRQETSTITQLVAGNPDLSILLKLVQAGNLAGLLSGPGPFTVFAPNDAAFAQTAQDLGLPADQAGDKDAVATFLTTGITALGASQNATAQASIAGILSYHVAGGRLTSEAVSKESQVTTLLTTEQNTIGISGNTLVDNNPALADPKLVTTDIQASNGVVHTIDRVLFPSPVNQEAVASAVAAQQAAAGGSAAPSTTAAGASTSASSTTVAPGSTTTTAAPVTTTTTEEDDTADETEEDDDDDSPCFPAFAKVHLPDGSEKPMHALSGGDIIRHSTDAKDAHSQVYLFSHKVRTGLRDFVRIESSSGHVITLTDKHYLYANGRLTTAGSVRVGDKLSTLDGPAVVSAVRGIKAEGLYAPHTMHGDIVVDRVLASSYTQNVHPSVAHYLLAPVRALAAVGFTEPLGGLLYEGADTLAAWAPKGRAAY